MKKYTSVPLKAGLTMYRPLYTVAIFMVLLFSSCKGQVSVTDSAGNHNKMKQILQDDHSGFEEEETLIIKDQQSLEKFFGKINRTRKPGLPVPSIDFSKNMLFVWCAGERNEGMPGLSMAQETEDAYIIIKKEPKKAEVHTAIMNPFAMYIFPKSDKKIILK